jgi:hypothetical protein
LGWLRDVAGEQLLSASVTPTGPTILAVRGGGFVTVLAANLEPEPRPVHLDLSEPCTTTGWAQIGEPLLETATTSRTVRFTLPPGGAIRWRGRI